MMLMNFVPKPNTLFKNCFF